MLITKTETREIEVASEVLCNRCGRSLKGTCGNFNGLVEATVDGAYDSPTFADGSEYKFSACEPCLSEWFASFKHDPCTKPNWLYSMSEPDEAE